MNRQDANSAKIRRQISNSHKKAQDSQKEDVDKDMLLCLLRLFAAKLFVFILALLASWRFNMNNGNAS
ncbi:MAG: hypothetical protein IT445_07980 [Phycisphaeraceae bacterium]|nr:hypothetical protein [Phycisphaeraceae bacterium]